VVVYDTTVAVYDQIGRTYSATRRADPRIARQIQEALGDAERVLNVGAGTGNYEPADRAVVALEPSMTMIRQRPAGSPPAVRGVAEQLPFTDGAFDAVLGTLTLHHWPDLAAGLAEVRRVSRRQVFLLFDNDLTGEYWLVDDYFPELRELPSEREAPTVADVDRFLDVERVEVVPVPADCTDGFGAAFWKRPEAHLDPEVLAGMSWTARLDPTLIDERSARLRADLDSGAWDRRNGHLRALDELDCGYRLVVAGLPSH
jgi:SAM-dependent methyltransferase